MTNKNKRLEPELIAKIRDMYAAGEKYEVIAYELTVSRGAIRSYTVDIARTTHPKHRRPPSENLQR